MSPLRSLPLGLGIVALVLSSLASAQVAGFDPALRPERQMVLDRISADSMRGHLSFLASDLLEGRGTPSRGLDLAAEYIASQLRRAGLEPGGDDGYFQMSSVTARGASEATPVKNVVGIIRGSDPVLKDTCVIVSAHYDHLGVRGTEGDTIFNGANDDGSGTVGVIELAWALAKSKPKRSIVFLAFYGEERGLLGSRFYGQHPTFPLEKTVAMVNLEQIGRTDDNEGPRVGAAAMTGFDFSDVGLIFAAAGREVEVEVQKHPQNSDSFFGRSDNQALANLGIPAHTICTAFEYPDYHKATDHWEKVEFDNMAKIVRMVAMGLMTLADSESEPKWNPENPKAARYLEAWKARRGG